LIAISEATSDPAIAAAIVETAANLKKRIGELARTPDIGPPRYFVMRRDLFAIGA
jgi:hypothetical protein